MRERSVLGVDIGGTKTLCALVDKHYKIVAAEKFRTAPEEGRKKFVDQLIGAGKALIKDARKEKINAIGVGVAVAGQVNNGKGDVQVAPNLVPLQNLNLRRLFQHHLKLDACLGNDVQLALYAEHQLGVAVSCDHVLSVFFGTGIGGAALGLAARQSAPHLFKEVGTDLAEVSWGALRRSIRKGDKAVEDLLRARLRLAGIALSNVVNFLNPEMLVLGGGLAEEMPQLLRAELEKALRSHLVPEVSKPLKVKLARFRNKAGAMGAARLAFETFG